jgi:RND family efflux transporter MFP subunit
MRRSLSMIFWALCLAGCKRSGEVEVAPGPKSVKCAPVRTIIGKDRIELRGTVAPLPDRDAQVAPQVTGRILRVEVREGDPVTSAQVVARVDNAPLLDAAEQADAALARAQAERQNADTTLARIQRVFEHGIAARQDVDDAAAKQAAAKAAEIEAQAGVRQARRQIERAVIRSPLKGVVLKVFRKPGELVDGTPATPILEVGDTSALELVGDVPAQDLVRLAPGAQAIIGFSALPGRAFVGVVSRVAPAVDRATGVGIVRIRIDPSASLAPPVGVLGVARVEVGQDSPHTQVPQAALRGINGEDGEVVVCGTDKSAHVRKLRVGPAGAGFVEVHGEIGPADWVAVEPVLGLAEDDRIEAKP